MTMKQLATMINDAGAQSLLTVGLGAGICHGENWRHKKTGKLCIAQSTPRGKWDFVKILHQSGRVTRKRVHYFLVEYEKIDDVPNVKLRGAALLRRPS